MEETRTIFKVEDPPVISFCTCITIPYCLYLVMKDNTNGQIKDTSRFPPIEEKGREGKNEERRRRKKENKTKTRLQE